LILYHYLTEGRAYARVTEGREEELVAGDIVIFPHGDAHYLGNEKPERPVDSLQAFSSHLKNGMKVVRFGGGGEITRFVCGFMACDPRLSEVLLGTLPRMLKVHIPREDTGEWIQNAIRFSADEANATGAGSSLVLAKLSELLFVETIRRYINGLPEEQTGWLAGVRDPVAGKTLALMHQDPAHAWTLEDLARRVGVSRTRLAERFRHFLQASPMAYLTNWRLNLAAEILQSTEDGMAEVAASVGYGSEAAFNRAFRRAFDCPPAQFRRNRRTALNAASAAQ
jgi:AraC-like DNA-binding protein